MNKIIKATLIISILRLFDMITTYIAINKFGIIIEGNKLIVLQAKLLGNLFLALLSHYVLTIIFTYFILRIIYYLNKKKRKEKPDLFKMAVIFFIIVFSIIPIWNLVSIIFG